jgi:hypothetical protein
MYPSGSGQTNGTDYQDGSGTNWGAALGSGMGNIFSGVGDLFGASKLNKTYPNPATGAMPFLNSIAPILQKYLSPYASLGASTLPTLQGQYGNLLSEGAPLQGQYNSLMSNPGGVINSIGKSFQASPGYNFQVGQAQNAANNAAAAGGMLGSPEEQQNIAGTVNNLANTDYYNYLGHALGQYDTGLAGAQGMYNKGLSGEEGLNQMGFQGSNNLAEDLASVLQSQASLSYAGQANQNQMQAGQAGAKAALQGSALSNIGSGIGALLGNFGSDIGSWL